MRIAFFDHPYHRITRSSQFFTALLAELGTFSTFYVEDNGALNKGAAFEEDDYDLIVVWQVHQAFRMLSGKHPNVVFVPMYDAMQTSHGFYWKTEFGNARTLSFSRKLHEEVSSRGAVSYYAQYFPNPANYQAVENYDNIRAFFWFRREPVDCSLVLELIGQTGVEKLTIHNAPDPGMRPQRIPATPENIGALKTTDWRGDGSGYRALLREHNVFFAPRVLEGIGMSFLEAMALGLCVVAPHASTMNEYIANGTNGILYPLSYRFPAEFSRLAEQGKRARESVERGYVRWIAQRDELLTFLSPASPPRVAAEAQSLSPLGKSGVLPKVSVVTVCLNAASDIEPTIQNVLAQDYPNFEYLVLDGGSEDGSAEIITLCADRLAYWHSQKDAGVYHAMNDAVQKCSGDFVLFMNAGDSFVSNDTLSRMFAKAPAGADIVFGHHLYVTPGGKEQYHPAADFETTWFRLKRGQLWHDWLSGIPGHQATAVKRSLLSELRFDTGYRIAADHDLLFRARNDGAQFFNCDELISLYRGGGLSAKNSALCHTEWAQIAAKFGPPEDVTRFYTKLKDARRTAPISIASGAAATLMDKMTTLFSSKRKTTLFEKVVPQGPMITGPVYDADLSGRIRFSREGLPSPLRSMQGMADVEPWGRWTIGRKAEFRFRATLPPCFQLILECFGSGENIGRNAVIRAGGGQARMHIGQSPGQMRRIVLKQVEPSDLLTIEIPYPRAPAEFQRGGSNDTRELGIGLVSLKIVSIKESEAEKDALFARFSDDQGLLKRALQSPLASLKGRLTAIALRQDEVAQDIEAISNKLRETDQLLAQHNEYVRQIRADLSDLHKLQNAMAQRFHGDDNPEASDEKLAAGWISLGKSNFALGRIEEALTAFRQASRLAHTSPASSKNLVQALLDLGLLEFSTEIVIDLISSPVFFAAASAVSSGLCEQDEDAAQRFLERLRNNNAPETSLDLLQAQFLARQGKFDLAKGEIDRTLGRSSGSVEAHRYAVALADAISQHKSFARLENSTDAKLLTIGSRSIVLPKDHPLDDYLKTWRRYSAALPQLIATTLKKYSDLTVIDVGANVGDSAAMIRAISNCPLLCVEGHPAFLPYLNYNVAVLDSDIEIEATFLAGKPGEVTISESSAVAGTASLTAGSPLSAKGARMQRLETLDSVLERQPRFARAKFLKVDADGYDFDILAGGEGFLAKAHPVVFFEYDPSISHQLTSAEQALSLLLKTGYSRLLAFDNFGNPLARIDHDIRGRLMELNRYLDSNRANGVAVYYLDLCAVHDDDADIFDALAKSSGFL